MCGPALTQLPACASVLTLDIMDDSGEHISGYSHDVYKTRLDTMGVPIQQEKAKSESPFFLLFTGEHGSD